MLQPDTAGRQDNLRPGDVLGALAGDAYLKADDVGKIDVFATRLHGSQPSAFEQSTGVVRPRFRRH